MEPWRSIETDGQQATWAANSDDVFWLHGRTSGILRQCTRMIDKSLRLTGSKTLLDHGRNFLGAWAVGFRVTHQENRVISGVPETYINTNAKTVAGLRYMLQHFSFDYLLRTNTSTYVNLRLLTEFVKGLPQEGYYGGPVGMADGIEYASGTGMLFSRDIVRLIACDPKWEFGVIDDVAVGRCMKRNGISLHPLGRVDILNETDIQTLNRDELRSTFLVRCKGNQGRDHDINVMHLVHAAYRDMGLA